MSGYGRGATERPEDQEHRTRPRPAAMRGDIFGQIFESVSYQE